MLFEIMLLDGNILTPESPIDEIVEAISDWQKRRGRSFLLTDEQGNALIDWMKFKHRLYWARKKWAETESFADQPQP